MEGQLPGANSRLRPAVASVMWAGTARDGLCSCLIGAAPRKVSWSFGRGRAGHSRFLGTESSLFPEAVLVFSCRQELFGMTIPWLQGKRLRLER